MHKRIIGTRQKCTPSTRWQHCTHHCLQILSARILAVMVHGSQCQYRIIVDGHIKTLVEALDPNHDPHLLCLLLQSLASIALNPSHHQALNDADIADMLMQLLLPSDEWYYTNHSTKYAKYVKYHAARILVYMGLLHKLGGRIDLFDRRPFTEASTNAHLQVHSPDDSFIELMAMGHVVMWNDSHHLQAASLEGLVSEVIEEAIADENETTDMRPMSSSAQSLFRPLDHTLNPILSPFISPTCSIDSLTKIEKKPFRDILIMGLPMLVHPIIILRLLAHKMFGNMIRRKSLYTETKLKPPKPENLQHVDMCPPRNDFEDGDGIEEVVKRDSVKKKRANLHISITKHIDDFESPPTTSSPNEKEFTRQNTTDSKNGTTKLALRAIGQTLANPFENSIPVQQQIVSDPYTTISSSDSSNEQRSNTVIRLFHWPSKKKLCKSQGNLSIEPQDSFSDKGDEQLSPLSPATEDIDIAAFQRELINLPQFVMETPADVSPIFSRSSSVPENLASRVNSAETQLGDLAAFGSDHSNLPCAGREVETHYKVPNSPSIVTITTTDFTTDYVSYTSELQTRDLTLPELSRSSMTNIVVHFEAPQSPMSSASQSPQAFEFPCPFPSAASSS
ncbi:hypothetical protein KUTeg_005014 [Tegillarca granosa]|uniref:Uncharacterized protein n=1 Tax=Tegillarca granosa TaxID=220873 RepID=A0ABQ9FLG5_TEGGR|nr:hypothetical protein KUTeg_005014 [Tegillarca granosa]